MALVPCANVANTLSAEKVESERFTLGHSEKTRAEKTPTKECIELWWAIHLDISASFLKCI